MTAAARADIDFSSLGGGSPESEYRQLSLMMLVTGGAQPALVDALLEDQATQGGAPAFDPDQYRTPLTRIVDQASMLAGSAHMFRFTRDHLEAIKARLREIEAANPEAVAGLNQMVVHEDAVVIRQAIANSIDYSGLGQRPDLQPLVEHYRAGTVRLRNILEYEQFAMELDRITAEAIQSVGGQLDAYQRMFEDELGTSTFDRHIDAAEYIYTRALDERAADLTENIIENMVLLESQPDR